MQNNQLPARATEDLDSFYAGKLGSLRYSKETEHIDGTSCRVLYCRPRVWPLVMMLEVVRCGMNELKARRHARDSHCIASIAVVIRKLRFAAITSNLV